MENLTGLGRIRTFKPIWGERDRRTCSGWATKSPFPRHHLETEGVAYPAKRFKNASETLPAVRYPYEMNKVVNHAQGLGSNDIFDEFKWKLRIIQWITTEEGLETHEIFHIEETKDRQNESVV